MSKRSKLVDNQMKQDKNSIMAGKDCSQGMIDPYGNITDSRTGEALEGVQVELFYAHTQRNIDNGNIPNTRVDSPLVDDFPPNNNANPQLTDSEGNFAFMVFPGVDCYMVAEKAGYDNYNSSNISVELDIIRHDFSMNEKSLSEITETKNSSEDLEREVESLFR